MSVSLLNPTEDPDIRRYIEEEVGERGLTVAAILARKEKATDTEIAEELHEKPSHVRRILYDLYAARVAEYHKEKDKATGWQTFIWSFTPQHARHAIDVKSKRGISDIQEQLQFEESNSFYVCPTDGRRFLFDEATDIDFRCPQCSAQLEFDDNAEVIEALRNKLSTLETGTKKKKARS